MSPSMPPPINLVHILYSETSSLRFLNTFATLERFKNFGFLMYFKNWLVVYISIWDNCVGSFVLLCATKASGHQ